MYEAEYHCTICAKLIGDDLPSWQRVFVCPECYLQAHIDHCQAVYEETGDEYVGNVGAMLEDAREDILRRRKGGPI